MFGCEGKMISNGISQLRDFSNVDRPQDLWAPFKSMLQQLQHISYRRSVIKLDDASPALRAIKGTQGSIHGSIQGGGNDDQTVLNIRLETKSCRIS